MRRWVFAKSRYCLLLMFHLVIMTIVGCRRLILVGSTSHLKLRRGLSMIGWHAAVALIVLVSWNVLFLMLLQIFWVIYKYWHVRFPLVFVVWICWALAWICFFNCLMMSTLMNVHSFPAYPIPWPDPWIECCLWGYDSLDVPSGFWVWKLVECSVLAWSLHTLLGIPLVS